ncbi:MAG: DUF6502 family protein [Gammaproteobacteria bacterium]|nr:DUF6502 family protein [Gammaproteobacteria bacterium]MDH5729498.1 DUF6502 family protein [Gammaproteobacteria bacterium]
MENQKQFLVKNVLRILKPVVRVLLRNQVSINEFMEIAKRAYVQVANKHFSIPNRKKTFARVAVITGLHLKEVKRVSQEDENEVVVPKGPINRANQVIGGWLSDKDFLDEQGQPRVLCLKDSEHCFDELVRRYSGDLTARAILDELERVGAVTRIDKQTIRLVQHGFIPEKSEMETFKIVATHASDLLETGVHNIEHSPEQARFQRQVTYVDVPESVMEAFRLYSREKSDELLRDFNTWLASNCKKTEQNEHEKTGRVGVGIYYFKDNDE